jgi:hypothetical protein
MLLNVWYEKCKLRIQQSRGLSIISAKVCWEKCFLCSVADPDPGFGVFLTPGFRIRDGKKIKIRIQDPDSGWTSRIIFPRAWKQVKNTKNSLMQMQNRNLFDPVSGIRDRKNSDPGSWWKEFGSGIRNYPGSATLFLSLTLTCPVIRSAKYDPGYFLPIPDSESRGQKSTGADPGSATLISAKASCEKIIQSLFLTCPVMRSANSWTAAGRLSQVRLGTSQLTHRARRPSTTRSYIFIKYSRRNV